VGGELKRLGVGRGASMAEVNWKAGTASRRNLSGCTGRTSGITTMERARSTISSGTGTGRRSCCEAGKIDSWGLLGGLMI